MNPMSPFKFIEVLDGSDYGSPEFFITGFDVANTDYGSIM